MKFCEEHGHAYQSVFMGETPTSVKYYVCSQCGQLLKFDLEKINNTIELK